MKPRGHLRILAIATLAWALFWVAGLPSYYLQYSFFTMVIVSIALIPPIVVVSYLLLRHVAEPDRLRRAAWIAFYFSVPLVLYDWLYCGVYLGYGVRFPVVFWYLTLFYAVPWVILPATAIALNRTQGVASTTDAL